MPCDSSEDEHDALIKESIDSTLFSNNLYNKNSVKEVQKPKKSNRHLENEEKHTDIRVSADMQKRVGDKVSKIINSQIEFIVQEQAVEKHEIEGGIKLFTDSENFIDHEHIEENYTQKPRKKIKRRNIEEDQINEKDRVKMVVLSPDYVTSKEELKHWKSKRKQKTFEYKKSKNGTLILHNTINKFEFK